jgi:hypothetical protein
MSRLLKVMMALGAMQVAACGSDKAGETGAVDEDSEESTSLKPQSGDWTVMTSGWNDDNCNAEEALTDIVTVTFSDIGESSFSLTLYEEGDIRVGNTTTCTHGGDNVFACDDFFHDVAIDGMDATINMVGIPTVTVNSETSTSGQGDLTLDCTGADCGFLTGGMPFTGFPCTATNNWTAVP